MIHVIVGNKMATTAGDAVGAYIEAGSLEEMKEQALAAADIAFPGQRCVIVLDNYREHRKFDAENGYSNNETVHEARALIYLEG